MKIILSILLLCSVLLADRDGGPYLGLGYGVSLYNDDDLYEEIKDDESTALIFYAGAYINKHLSVEIGYVDFNIRDSYKIVDDSDLERGVDFSSLNISTLAHYAFFDDVLDFYAKFGVGNMSATGVGTDGFTMLFGGGVGVRFSERLSIKIAYDRYLIDYTKDVVKRDMYIDFVYSAFEVQF